MRSTVSIAELHSEVPQHVPLARHEKWQLKTNFTVLLLHNYYIEKDYK